MSPKRLIDLLRRPARENLLGRIAVGGLPSDGSDTDARCQQEAREAAYRRPVKQRPLARDSRARGIVLGLGKLFLRARDLFTRALDLFISVRELFFRAVHARAQDIARIGLFLVQRSIH